MWTTVRNRSAVALALLAAACGSQTSVVNSWKDPTVPVRQYQKILAVYISNDLTARRTAEDVMAQNIPRTTAAYRVVPEGLLKDADKAKAWVQEQGYDALILMRPVAADKETSYVPGSAYSVPYGSRSAWGYYGAGWGYAGDPGHYVQSTVIYVETNVYALTDEAKLVWSSRSKSYDPSNTPKMVEEIITANVEEMKKQNVIAGGV